DICTALQLANHWQDVSIDLTKDRIYLPGEDLAVYGVSVGDLRGQVVSQNFVDLMKHEVSRTRELFVRGKPLCLAAGGRLGLELRAVWAGGTRILDLIEAGGYDVFNRRPVITNAEKLRALYYAVSKRAFRHR